MILTEKEARAKWCPQTMPSYDPMKAESPRNCEGTDCFAWRWDDPKQPRCGYCGLAGKPKE